MKVPDLHRPARAGLMQEWHEFWLARLQPHVQRFTEEIMIAIPLPLLIQRHKEEKRGTLL